MAEEPAEGEAVPVSDQCSNGDAAMFAEALRPCTALGTLLEIETQELAQIMVNSESFSCGRIYISSDFSALLMHQAAHILMLQCRSSAYILSCRRTKFVQATC